MAKRHLRAGQQRVADQQARVAWLEQAGHDTHQSRVLLATMTTTLRLMAEHLAIEEEEARQLGQPATITAWPWANRS